MPWRSRVNKVLVKTTGYRIVRAHPDKNGKPEFPLDYDEMALPIMRAATPYTRTRREKKYALYLATRYVVENEMPAGVDAHPYACQAFLLKQSRLTTTDGPADSSLSFAFNGWRVISRPVEGLAWNGHLITL